MPTSEFSATIQRILLSGQQLVRVASIPDKLLPAHDREFMLSNAVSTLRDSINEFHDHSKPSSQEATDSISTDEYIILSEPSAFVRCLGMLQDVLNGIRDRWNAEQVRYWDELASFYGAHPFDEEGEFLGDPTEAENLDWPTEAPLSVCREELDRLKVVLPHLELASITLPSETDSNEGANANPIANRPITPRWDPEKKQVTYKGIVCVQFTNTASQQTVLLNAFEEQGWPHEIPNPFKGDPERLKSTIRYLRDQLTTMDSPIIFERRNCKPTWRVKH